MDREKLEAEKRSGDEEQVLVSSLRSITQRLGLILSMGVGYELKAKISSLRGEPTAELS
jgi:hypothetical protein